MGSSFTDIIANAQRTIQKNAGVKVKYSDGTHWVNIQAVPGKTDFQLEDQSGVISSYRSRDYIVYACDLVLNNVAVLPQRGHTITEQIGTQLHTYEVSKPDGSEQPYRYSATGHDTFRIHTKLKGIANV